MGLLLATMSPNSLLLLGACGGVLAATGFFCVLSFHRLERV